MYKANFLVTLPLPNPTPPHPTTPPWEWARGGGVGGGDSINNSNCEENNSSIQFFALGLNGFIEWSLVDA